MKDSRFIIQKRLSTMLLIAGGGFLFANISSGISRGLQYNELLTNPYILILFFFILTISLTMNIDKEIVRIIQVIIFILNFVIATILQLDIFYGFGFYILAVILMLRYRYFKSYSKMKIASLVLFFIVIIELSSFLNKSELLGDSVGIVVFITFFIFNLYIIYGEEINIILLTETKRSIRENHSSLGEIEMLKQKIRSLENNIEGKKSDSLSEFNFTLKEELIIKLLCTEKMSNKELSEELFISTGTVKQHLNNIYNKCGVNKRIKVIYLFNDCF